MKSKVIIGTRGSQLALWQSRWTADRLRETHDRLEVELQIIKTSGDTFREAALTVLGGKGVFTKEIQDAVLDGRVDVAVHSLKDLPTQIIPGLRVWAHPQRFNPCDAWIGRGGIAYLDLPADATIATGSLRRGAQVLARYPGAVIEPLRGNVDTRLRKFEEGEKLGLDGMILAQAGLERLRLTAHVTEVLDAEIFLPAPGQGALAIEGRDDDETRHLLAPLDDRDTRDRVTAERMLLARLEGGCQVPIGALARLDGSDMVLDALVSDVDGCGLIRQTMRAPRDQAEKLGRDLACALLARGGDAILERIRQAQV